MKYNPIRLVYDAKDLNRRLARVDQAVRTDAASKGLRSGAEHLIQQIKIKISDIDLIDSGDLMGSVQEDELHVSTHSWITFGPHKVYAAIHEFGGTIVPINGPYLVFQGKDGKTVFAKSVTIPARPYIRPTLDSEGQAAFDLMGKTIGDILEGKWNG